MCVPLPRQWLNRDWTDIAILLIVGSTNWNWCKRIENPTSSDKNGEKTTHNSSAQKQTANATFIILCDPLLAVVLWVVRRAVVYEVDRIFQFSLMFARMMCSHIESRAATHYSQHRLCVSALWKISSLPLCSKVNMRRRSEFICGSSYDAKTTDWRSVNIEFCRSSEREIRPYDRPTCHQHRRHRACQTRAIHVYTLDVM